MVNQVEQAFDRGGFTGTVGPQEPVYFTGLNRKIDIFQDRYFTEVKIGSERFLQMGDFYGVHGSS
jgi:hypothetical protein